MKYRKRTLALVMAAITALSLMVGSLAYFTDRVEGKAEATAGTLDLVLKDTSNKENQMTVGGDASAFKPGYAVTIDYSLANAGNKSADIKETFVLTVKDSAGNAMALSETAPQFQLFQKSDVVIASDNTVTINSGVTPLATVSANQLIYHVDQYTLNGTGTGAEIEAGITTNLKTCAYVLVFMPTAGNEFQNVDLTLNYVAQAKQHRNSDTSDAAWDAVYETDVLKIGNTDIKVVPVNP